MFFHVNNVFFSIVNTEIQPVVKREAFDGHALGKVAIIYMQDMQHWGYNYKLLSFFSILPMKCQKIEEGLQNLLNSNVMTLNVLFHSTNSTKANDVKMV